MCIGNEFKFIPYDFYSVKAVKAGEIN